MCTDATSFEDLVALLLLAPLAQRLGQTSRLAKGSILQLTGLAMPFRFGALCNLLTGLEEIECHDPPLLKKALFESQEKVVASWFLKHRNDIEHATTDRAALLSSMFPERRTDRIFLMQAARLTRVIGRCLRLNTAKLRDLEEWKTPGHGDLGACVERVLREYDAEPRPGHATVEEIDTAMNELASRCRFSAPAVRAKPSGDLPEKILGPIFLKLHSGEAKWLTRMLLKNYAPITMNERLIFRHFHFLLPDILSFQNDFDAVVALLDGPLKDYPPRPDFRSEKVLRATASALIVPKVGVKVGRPTFYKARSIEHCLNMVGSRRWSLERKYDGEYCEIHIDLSRGDDCIKIFSKSGKDSTVDRKAVHKTIRDCLRIGRPDCRFKNRCIVVGELLVYSDEEKRILDFHKLRKHVTRSGSFLGTNRDSQPHAHEHLMIVFYDVLMVDDDVTMSRPYEDRRACLRNLIRKKAGHAMTSEWRTFDFCSSGSKKALVKYFAASVVSRCEGLVLKPCEGPYFHLGRDEPGKLRGRFIKLKKDYIIGMGDIADLAIVGARYDAKEARSLHNASIQWTTFYLGCLENKDAVTRFHDVRPVFRVIDTIKAQSCIPQFDLKTLNELGKFQAEAFEVSVQPTQFDLKLDSAEFKSMEVVFQDPFVSEVLGSGFDKPPNSELFTLRHPRILKLHMDRNWRDCTSLQELQSMAEDARSFPADRESTELDELVQRLRKSPSKKSPAKSKQLATELRSYQENESTPAKQKSPRQAALLHAVRADSARHCQNLVHSTKASINPPSRVLRSTSGNGLPTPPSSDPRQAGQSTMTLSDTMRGSRKSKKRLLLEISPEVGDQKAKKSKLSSTTITINVNKHTNLSPLKGRSSASIGNSIGACDKEHKLNQSPPRAPRRKSVDLKTPSKTSGHGSPRVILSEEHASGSISSDNRSCSNTCVCLALDRAVFYIWPSVAQDVPDTIESSAGCGVVRTYSLEHWCRENHQVPLLSAVISESQAYPGLSKILLVDPPELGEVVQEVVTLKIRDTVAFWDWRALAHTKVSIEAPRPCRKRCFLGTTEWKDEERKMIFIKPP